MLAGTNTISRMEFNSAEAIFNQGGVDLDFRVESDGQSHMFFLDAGNDRIGIGESSPDDKVTINVNSGSNDSRAIHLVGGADVTNKFISIGRTHSVSNDYISSEIRFGTQSGGVGNAFFAIATGDNDPSERFRIDNGGDTFINATSDPTPFTAKFCVVGTGNVLTARTTSSSGATVGAFQTGSYNGGVNVINFYNNSGGTMGTISATNGLNGTAVSYNTSSDYRLKENVTADWNATTRLKQLNPVRFNFIADADTTVDGFLAHEVQSVVPEAITGTHNEVDDDGNPVMQGIDQSKLVPLLTKALQEQQATIEALTARIVTLEGA
jgi:hypothetical protein